MTFDDMAVALEQSGDYRVLKRLALERMLHPADGQPVRSGLFVDVETTGLDPTRDEIIEIAMIPFSYGLDGRIYEVSPPFEGLQEPSLPIPAHITAITGIDDAMVSGHSIDAEAVARFATPASLVIAHNAAFDRRFLERLSDVFTTKPWACSMTQIDWVAEGFEGAKLAYLSMGAGFFYDRHRAAHDCAAGIALLAGALPRSGEVALGQLLRNARTPTWRIWAEGAPFDLKDILKSRGYRWNGDTAIGPKAWYADVKDGEQDSERTFLQREIYLREIDPVMRRMNAFDRFSDRV
jgi:DNA polymerase-3 subunit epsilon